jgi:hypothetical protein
MTFYQAIERYRLQSQEGVSDPLGVSSDPDALALSCWGLVHGIAILIAKKDFVYEGDYLELAKKIFWKEMFLT